MFYYLLNRHLLQRANLACRYRTSQTMVLDNISSFGSLIVYNKRTPTFISTIDPLEFKNGDTAVINMNADHCIHDYFNVQYDRNQSILSIIENEKDFVREDKSLNIQIPCNYDLDIYSLSIDIKETEGNNLKLQSEGNCILGKIKSVNAMVKCNGIFKCQSFLGNGLFSVTSAIDIIKIQSNELTIKCQENIKLAAVYAQKLNCYSLNGSIGMNSFHGNAFIKTGPGSISVSSIMGDLKAESITGNIDVIIDRTEKLYLSSKSGDINVGVTDSVSAYIEAEGKYIDVPEDFLFDGMKAATSNGMQTFEGKLGDGKSSLELTTMDGTISLRKESLFSKLNIGDD